MPDVMPQIATPDLIRPVGQLVGHGSVEVLDVSISPVHVGWATARDGGGLFRFVGTARTNGMTIPWSLVLKTISMPDEVENLDPVQEGPRRDVLAYRSGILNDLPGGLAAPHCYGTDVLLDRTTRIWLEDLSTSTPGAAWAISDYGVAARYLGAFNGAYLTGRSLPDAPWLTRRWLRTWTMALEPQVARFRDAAGQGGFGHLLPDEVVAGVLQLWDQREKLLTAVEQLPRTFSHLDAFHQNLFLRRLETGQQQTTAVDWTYAGIAALGEELAPLVAASALFRGIAMSTSTRSIK